MKTEKELLKIGFEAEIYRLTNELSTMMININSDLKIRIDSDKFVEKNKNLGDKMTELNLLFDGYHQLNNGKIQP